MMSKKAIVTGGSRGIGKGIALVLAKEGYDVAISYSTRVDAAEAVAKEIEALGQKCYYFQANLNKDGVANELFAKCVEALGGLDLLVNNAGLTICEPIQKLTEEKLDELLK